MKINFHLFPIMLLLSLCPFVLQASELMGSGEILAMLQKIQGEWRTVCKPMSTGKDSYSSSKLSVSFTHFSLKTTEYRGGRCVQVSAVKEEQYRFALLGSQQLDSGKTVFAINFKLEPDFGDKPSFYPLNIIRYEDGKLLLGDDFVNPKGQRLKQLNPQLEFVR